ncbi:MAG: hypothetical protein JST85_18135 [Acidobacteria bacterium]|nr:hypothetical protein [Acidobacteriota bacterium]
MLFGVNSTSAAIDLSKRDIQTCAAQSSDEFIINRDQQSANIETNCAVDTQHLMGGKVIAGLEWPGGAARTALAYRNDKQTLARRVTGSVIELGSATYGLTQQYSSIQNRAEGQQLLLNRAAEGLIANQTKAAQDQVADQDIYFRQQPRRIGCMRKGRSPRPMPGQGMPPLA